MKDGNAASSKDAPPPPPLKDASTPKDRRKDGINSQIAEPTRQNKMSNRAKLGYGSAVFHFVWVTKNDTKTRTCCPVSIGQK